LSTRAISGAVSAPLVDIERLRAALPDEVTLNSEIRSGGQRAVYDVDIRGDRRVLKLMPDYARDRAEREVAIGTRFEHRGLARILDELRDIEIDGKDYVYFTEEFVEGVSLDRLKEPLNLCEALALAAQLIAATEHLYAQHRVVHRDVKPANVMKRQDGSYALLDVGVGRHQDLTTLTAEDADHGPGTRGYLAPEQLQASKGHELDWRTDQFAVGTVLFEQLVGRLPFDPYGPSYRTLLMTGTVASWDAVPEVARQLLQRMLHPKPHRRFRLGRAALAIAEVRSEAGC
jgi:serine/threonine protein kinase